MAFVNPGTVQLPPKQPINCHPNSTCPACQPKSSTLNPRQRLLRNARRNLSNPGQAASRFIENPVRSLQSGGEVLWNAVTNW